MHISEPQSKIFWFGRGGVGSRNVFNYAPEVIMLHEVLELLFMGFLDTMEEKDMQKGRDSSTSEIWLRTRVNA